MDAATKKAIAETMRSLAPDNYAIQNLIALPGYPFMPCPICHGVESCDHTVPERARASHPGLQPLT